MAVLDLSRQSNIVTGSLDKSILIVGAGGIGSNVAHVAVAMGFEDVTIYDNDVVKEENLAPQLLSPVYLLENKAFAVANIIQHLTDIVIKPVPDKFLRQGGQYDIVIIGVDSIQARRSIWKQSHLKYNWWLDGRMGGTTGEIYFFSGQDRERIKWYEDSLELTPRRRPCGEKATAFITKGLMPGIIGMFLRHIVNDTWEKVDFVTSFDAESMFPFKEI